MPQLVSLHDKASIRAYTMHNPLLHIYEIGDLDDFFWPHTVWYGWVDEGVITQLALLYMPFSPPSCSAMPIHGALTTASFWMR